MAAVYLENMSTSLGVCANYSLILQNEVLTDKLHKSLSLTLFHCDGVIRYDSSYDVKYSVVSYKKNLKVMQPAM